MLNALLVEMGINPIGEDVTDEFWADVKYTETINLTQISLNVSSHIALIVLFNVSSHVALIVLLLA